MQRSTFLAASIPLAACATAACAGKTTESIGLVETKAQFDFAGFAKAVDKAADVRQVWDANELHPQILGGVKNSLNGLQFGFGIDPTRISMVLVAHGPSNVLLYDASAWATYQLGDLFKVQDPRGNTVPTNIFAPSRSTSESSDPNDLHGFYQDASITTLQRRGVIFCVCNTALVEGAQTIVRAGGSNESVDAVADALRAHLLPGVILVPSGSATVALLQSRYHYAYAAES